MSLGSFRVIPKTALGVDIGTSSVKMVELSIWGERTNLKNYGEVQSSILYDKPFRSFEKNTLLLSSKDIAKAIRAIMQDAKVESKRAIFSIPDFSSFFTNFELPPMSKDELPAAIQFEARKHVPVPLSEVTFDWQLIGTRFDEKKPSRILLVAVPNETINQYQEIARLSQIELVALEAEVFGFMRAALRGDRGPVVLVDIGAQTTTVSIAFEGILRSSYSVDLGGNSFTDQIAKSLGVSYEAAEEEKKKHGITPSSENRRILTPLIDVLLGEIDRAAQAFIRREQKTPEKVIIGGGSALLAGIDGYIQEHTRTETEVIDPFREIFFPPILEKTIKEIGPSYAIAVGMALRGLE